MIEAEIIHRNNELKNGEIFFWKYTVRKIIENTDKRQKKQVLVQMMQCGRIALQFNKSTELCNMVLLKVFSS